MCLGKRLVTIFVLYPNLDSEICFLASIPLVTGDEMKEPYSPTNNCLSSDSGCVVHSSSLISISLLSHSTLSKINVSQIDRCSSLKAVFEFMVCNSVVLDCFIFSSGVLFFFSIYIIPLVAVFPHYNFIFKRISNIASSFCLFLLVCGTR